MQESTVLQGNPTTSHTSLKTIPSLREIIFYYFLLLSYSSVKRVLFCEYILEHRDVHKNANISKVIFRLIIVAIIFITAR